MIIKKMKEHFLAMLGLDFEVDFQEESLSRIADDLYLGARPKPAQIDMLRQAGITHVVSCLNIEKRADVEFLQSDFQTLFLPLRDAMHEDFSAALPAFFDFVENAKQSSPNSKLFVHCEVGVSRSASLVIALLMQRKQISFYEAYIYLRSKRAKVLPNIGFASQLQQFEHSQQQCSARSDTLSSLARYLHQICHVPLEIDLLQDALVAHDFQALAAIHAIFGEDVPRVIQGVKA